MDFEQRNLKRNQQWGEKRKSDKAKIKERKKERMDERRGDKKDKKEKIARIN